MTPKGYLCQAARTPPTLIGPFEGDSWDDAAWTDDFVDILGDEGPPPRFRTRVKMLWDQECLYLGAEMEDPHVWATLTEHDSVIFQDNAFEVFLDPDGDNHLYAELEINGLNTTWDLLLIRPYRDGGPAVNGWECKGLRTAVTVHGSLNDPSDEDDGWSVGIALPFAALQDIAGCPCPPNPGDQWRINFSRVQWRHEIIDGRYRKVQGLPEDNWVWSPQGAIDMHRPERWGYVQFAVGDESLRALDDLSERETLMAVYHAQKAFRQEHGRWAQSSEELGAPPAVTLETTVGFFEAHLDAWQIDPTSRLTRRPTRFG